MSRLIAQWRSLDSIRQVEIEAMIFGSLLLGSAFTIYNAIR
jgi:hypothetical protein